MDISKLTHGAKLVLGATIAVPDRLDLPLAGGRHGIGSGGVNMWHGWGVLAGLIAIAIIVWEGLRLANMKIEIGAHAGDGDGCARDPAARSSRCSKFLVGNEFRTFWAWLGLLLAILIAVGAWVNMKALGESITEMGSSMKTAAGSAAAAAKAATDKGSTTLRAAAPAARLLPLLRRRGSRRPGPAAGRSPRRRPPQHPRPRPRGAVDGRRATRRRRRDACLSLVRDCLLPPCGSRHPATLDRMARTASRPRPARCASRAASPRCSRAA